MSSERPTERRLVSDIDIPHKELESCRGFLVYVTRTYGAMVPYLKGVHHTLDSWRPERDVDGWKFQRVTKPEDLTASGRSPDSRPARTVCQGSPAF
jgi:hypothetical protein